MKSYTTVFVVLKNKTEWIPFIDKREKQDVIY